MSALDSFSTKTQRIEPSGGAGGVASPGFAVRWTEAFLALLDELGAEVSPSLDRTAALLAHHAARLIPGVQCAISVVEPDRPEWFSLLAGEGEWAESLVGSEWPLEGTLNGRAMIEGVSVETTRAPDESATDYVFASGGIETGRIVPLRLRTALSDGRLALGAIGFWRTGTVPYTDEERSLIDTFGELASVLLHRAELLGTAVRATQRLEFALDVAVATGESLVPTSVMRRLLERSLDAAHADRASLCRIQGSTMTVLDVVDRHGAADSVGERFEQPWHPAVEQAVAERRAVAVERFEFAGLPESSREAVRDSERTLFLPLLAEGEVVALLSVMRRDDRPFTDADVSTVQLIGNIASLSLRNAERYAESERAHRRSLQALLEVTRHVDDTLELSAFLSRLAQSVARIVRARRAAFLQVDDAGRLTVHTPFDIGAGDGGRAAGRVRRGSGLWRVVFDDETVRSTDELQLASLLPRMHAHSGVAVPWRAGDRVLGSLLVLDSLDDAGFTDEDVWVLRIVALAAGLVWQHKQVEARELQLTREARERVHEMTVVQEAAQALSATSDINEVFREVVQAAAHVVTPSTGLERRATLLRIEGSTARLVAEYDEAGTHTDIAVYDLVEHPHMRRVIEDDDLVTIDLSNGDVPEPTARQMRAIGVQSSLLAPVRVEDTVVAILRVSARDDAAFGPVQHERLQAIANVAGLAVGNAERYQYAQREALRRAELENLKSEFLRLASHELRGPIGLLRGYLSMFDDGTVPEVSGQARETLPILIAKVAQMGRMVDDMLETARLEEGKTPINIEHLDLGTLVRRAVDTVRPLSSGEHALQVRLPEQPVYVAADKASVETILTNLLDNAIKYSPDGGQIDCVVRSGSGTASVAVRDRGLGISGADLSRLFTRFGRILTPENSAIPGTGLGLHLARELARMQGGTISVRSRAGQGSVFTLRLPRSATSSTTGPGAAGR